ncbi:cysteine hydrolase family protein [Chloroflexota bacterium]
MAEQLSIDRRKTAVLIMDYQLRQLGFFSEEFQKEILGRTSAVLAKVRQAGVPVIYVEVVRGERTPERAIHPSVAPKSGETVLTKHRTGPFSTTNIDEVLKKQGIDTLVLMGISTSGCVLTTVRCAADMDYKLIVLSDCCADQDDEVQRVLMEKVFPWHNSASVVTSKEFLLTLERD